MMMSVPNRLGVLWVCALMLELSVAERVTAEETLVAAVDMTSDVVGLRDIGVLSDWDRNVIYPLPPGLALSKTTIAVNKARRVMTLLYGRVPIKAYPITLGFSPVGDKERQGDGRTPEGKYFVCERQSQGLEAKYGTRSMRLSYPSEKDARRGAERGIVSTSVLLEVERAIAARNMPPQGTKLGGSIRIHGGGIDGDWTAGCIAVRDSDAVEVFDATRLGTQVLVSAGAPAGFSDRDGDGIADQVDIALGALKTVLDGAEYDASYQVIPFPQGDVDRKRGCCTDVVIRALRNAGFDLQELVAADIAKRPRTYSRVAKADHNIDHRRVSNLRIYFEHAFERLPTLVDRARPDDWLPGDVVLFDTLSKPGPDHIGVISPRRGPSGLPLVINSWTTGMRTSEMDLLDWVKVTHHFRVRLENSQPQ